MSDRDLKCEQRIGQELESRLQDMKGHLDALDAVNSSEEGAHSTCTHCERDIIYEEGVWIDPEAPATPEDGDDHIWRETCDAHDTFTAEHEPIDDETVYDQMRDYPLAVSVKKILRVELSWGGPQDFIEVEMDGSELASHPVYHFADWFDHAERQLSGSDAETVERWIETAIPLDAVE